MRKCESVEPIIQEIPSNDRNRICARGYRKFALEAAGTVADIE